MLIKSQSIYRVRFMSASINNLSVSSQEFSVSQFSQLLKGYIEQQFSSVRIRGELSGYKVHSSGHAYFALKDENSLIDGVCWRGQVLRIPFIPQDGMEVIVTGKITTYPGRSKYQVVCESMEIAGEGALLKILEERKVKMAALGYFSAERKKKLPYLPEIIGVVTSPTGAVIRDIMHRIEDRFPRRIIVWPVLVQGEGAAAQIARAIQGFNDMSENRPDVIIVARGGGSIEDLWAFNEEEVIISAVKSQIPIVSAVGHETDITLLDYAADLRAPTPTGAAEMVVPVRLDLMNMMESHRMRLVNTMIRFLNERKVMIQSFVRGLPNLPSLLNDSTQRVDDWFDRMQSGFSYLIQKRGIELQKQIGLFPAQLKTFMQKTEHRYLIASTMLESLSYTKVLQRGFTITKDGNGNPLTSALDFNSGQKAIIVFKDGEKEVIAE